jgi:DNA-directed RNA polymerase subunit RPC12/RpoP
MKRIKCPYCDGVIKNFKNLYFNKTYRCTRCDGKYLIIQVPKEIFAYF